MKKIMKNVAVFAVICFMLMPMFSLTVSAQADFGINYGANLGIGGGDEDPRDVAVNIIRIIMTFLGIIATVIILLGGFKWMTAQGSDDKVAEAKKLIAAGVIGMVIIMASFMIVSWVFSQSENILNYP